MGITVHDVPELFCFAVSFVSFTAYLFLSRCDHD
jgi:hypothetical protein